MLIKNCIVSWMICKTAESANRSATLWMSFLSKIKIDLLGKIDWKIDWNTESMQNAVSQLNRNCRISIIDMHAKLQSQQIDIHTVSENQSCRVNKSICTRNESILLFVNSHNTRPWQIMLFFGLLFLLTILKKSAYYSSLVYPLFQFRGVTFILKRQFICGCIKKWNIKKWNIILYSAEFCLR